MTKYIKSNTQKAVYTVVCFKKHLFSFTIFCILCLHSLLIAGPSGSASNEASSFEKSQIEQIESDLSREKEQFLKFDSKERDLLKQLSDIENAIEQKRALLRDIKEKYRDMAEQMKIQQKELAGIKESMQKTEAVLGQRLVAFYKYARRGYLRMISTTENLHVLNRRMKFMGLILNEDHQLMEQMFQEYAAYKETFSSNEKNLETMTKLKETESSRLLSIKEDLDKKVILLAKIHKEKEFYGTAVHELELGAQVLKQAIFDIEKEQKTEKVFTEEFSRLKGKLPLPLEGKIIKSSAVLGTENRGDQRGVYIKGESGAEVKSVCGGRIDFSDKVRGYGQVVIINHGSRFFTIFTNLLNREKESGENVKAGEIIGLVGETGLPIGTGLYFEIRQGGTNLDPMDWLKVD